MLISCSSCNSKYLINSADLKPNGRTVRCAICNYEWFQEPILQDNNIDNLLTPDDEKNSTQKVDKTYISNLPSTYVKESKPSFLNSILVILLLIIFFIVFWYLKNESLKLLKIFNLLELSNIIELFKYYVSEFYFNLNLIITDIAKLAHKILN